MGWGSTAVEKLVTKPDSPETERKKKAVGGGNVGSDSGAAAAPAAGSKRSFAAFKSREGPSALGSKEIPMGKPGCLSGLKFVVTGELESITRDDAVELIQRYGGKKQVPYHYIIGSVDPWV